MKSNPQNAMRGHVHQAPTIAHTPWDVRVSPDVNTLTHRVAEIKPVRQVQELPHASGDTAHLSGGWILASLVIVVLLAAYLVLRKRSKWLKGICHFVVSGCYLVQAFFGLHAPEAVCVIGLSYLIVGVIDLRTK